MMDDVDWHAFLLNLFDSYLLHSLLLPPIQNLNIGQQTRREFWLVSFLTLSNRSVCLFFKVGNIMMSETFSFSPHSIAWSQLNHHDIVIILVFVRWPVLTLRFEGGVEWQPLFILKSLDIQSSNLLFDDNFSHSF